MEIIKYNIEKLGGIESTIARMEPSLQTFEMRNIEKNLESVNNPAVHPKFFDPSKGMSSFQQQSNYPQSSTGVRGRSQGATFPYGGYSSSPADVKSQGQYQPDYRMTPDLSNYPCKLS